MRVKPVHNDIYRPVVKLSGATPDTNTQWLVEQENRDVLTISLIGRQINVLDQRVKDDGPALKGLRSLVKEIQDDPHHPKDQGSHRSLKGLLTYNERQLTLFFRTLGDVEQQGVNISLWLEQFIALIDAELDWVYVLGTRGILDGVPKQDVTTVLRDYLFTMVRLLAPTINRPMVSQLLSRLQKAEGLREKARVLREL